MKRFAILSLSVLLFACSTNESTKSKKEVCKGLLNNISIKNEFEHKDNRIEKIQYYSETNLTQLGLQVEEVEAQVKQMKTKYDVLGITYSYTIENGILRETTKVNLKTTKIADLSELGLISSTVGKEKSLSMNTIKEQQEALGLTCEE